MVRRYWVGQLLLSPARRMSKYSQNAEVSAMRDLGRSLKEQGFFEVDLSTGYVAWANDFGLQKLGLTLGQIQSMTVFDIVPHELHEAVRNTISDQVHGRSYRFSIRPSRATDGRLVWWYSVRVRAEHPLYWFRCEYLNTTGASGVDYNSMCAAMNTAAGYNELYNELQDLRTWTHDNVNRIDGAHAEMQEDMAELKQQLRAAVTASHRAANAALESKATVEKFKSEVSDQLSKQTAEILRLISNDSAQSEQMKQFDDFMKQATATTVARIERTTDAAVKKISHETSQSGAKISRKITVPVSVIAAIATLVQWLIQHYHK